MNCKILISIYDINLQDIVIVTLFYRNLRRYSKANYRNIRCSKKISEA